MIEITRHTLDIDKILESKMGDRAKKVPRFLVNWLKNIMHQEWLNKHIWDTRQWEGSDWLAAVLRSFNVTLQVHGEENLPAKDDQRRYTFVSNHPLGGIDGIAIGSVIGKHYDDNFRYLVNDLLMNLPSLAPLCIPINKTGKQSRDFPRMVEEGFSSDHHMLMFPAGLCSRLINGEIHDIPWTKTFVTKSIQTQRDVVPIYFSGHNSRRFYRIAKLCKALRLKFNVAMLFLVDEMYKNQGKTFHIYIGKPIPYQTFDKSRTPKQWAQWVEDEVYKMRPADEKF